MANHSGIETFVVQVPEAVLRDLRERLARTRWPDESPDAGWDYGTTLAYLKGQVAYWHEAYDWRAHERLLNGSHHYRALVDGLRLHFIHEPGVGPHPLPLLLCHGWPGSVYEFHKIIGPLTDPARSGDDPQDAFSVVAPSLPGYGFSHRPRELPMTIGRIATLFAAPHEGRRLSTA